MLQMSVFTRCSQTCLSLAIGVCLPFLFLDGCGFLQQRLGDRQHAPRVLQGWSKLCHTVSSCLANSAPYYRRYMIPPSIRQPTSMHRSRSSSQAWKKSSESCLDTASFIRLRKGGLSRRHRRCSHSKSAQTRDTKHRVSFPFAD